MAKRDDYVSKLDEAEYFLRQMSVNVAWAEPFHFNLHAFLSAARSVLQCASKECEDGPPSKYWYDQWARRPAIKFLKVKRNFNIHDGTLRSDTGVCILTRSADLPTEPCKEWDDVWPARKHYCWRFRDWPEDDVQTLCEEYLSLLWLFVREGAEKGFLGRESGTGEEP